VHEESSSAKNTRSPRRKSGGYSHSAPSLPSPLRTQGLLLDDFQNGGSARDVFPAIFARGQIKSTFKGLLFVLMRLDPVKYLM